MLKTTGIPREINQLLPLNQHQALLWMLGVTPWPSCHSILANALSGVGIKAHKH